CADDSSGYVDYAMDYW
nr:immunoglobulin heavy chain junction region [Mus musculus]